MTTYTTILQKLVDAGGALERQDLGESNHRMWARVSELKSRGYLVTEYRITDEGREYLANPPKVRFKRPSNVEGRIARGFANLKEIWRNAPAPEPGPYPLATTDEQIEKLKEQAEAGRSFELEAK